MPSYLIRTGNGNRVFADSISNELRHTGIKGMKWYVRRYQNKDGTLTAEGVLRYRKKKRFGTGENTKSTLAVSPTPKSEKTIAELNSETEMMRAQKNNLEARRFLNEELKRNTPAPPDSKVKKVINTLGPVLSKSLTEALGQVVKDTTVFYIKKALKVSDSNKSDKKKVIEKKTNQ